MEPAAVRRLREEVERLQAAKLAAEAHARSLAESEARHRAMGEREYTALAENAPDVISRYDRQFRHLYVNSAIERATGVPPDQFIGKTYREIGMTEQLWEAWEAKLREVFEQRREAQLEFSHPSPSGDRQYEARFAPEFGPDGSVGSVVVIGRDITELKRAEEGLRASEERYRFLAESIPQMVWSCDASGQLLDFNQRWFEYTGQTPAEAGGSGWAQVLHPEDRDRVLQQWMHSLRTGEKYESEGRLRRASDGSYRWHLAQAVPMRDAKGRIVRWFGTCTDIDDLRRASLERLRLATLVENSQDFIKVSELDGTVLFLNAGGRKLVGLDPDAPLPHSAEFLFPQDRPLLDQSVIPAVLQKGRWTGEINFRHFKTGEPIAMLWEVFRIDDPQTGRPLHLATVSRDIRERKRIEQERERLLKETQRAKEQAEAASRAKDHFLAILSHELRTPLTPALAKVAMMQREPDLSHSIQEGLELVRRNVELEAQLINDLLDTTRIVRGKLELHPGVVDAHAKVREAADIFQREMAAKSLHLTLDLRATRYHVRADPTRLQQVFWNLISNAVKYTPQHGRITIRSTDRPGDILRIQFIDTGIGIEPEVMRRLFTAFEQGEQSLTRRFGGLGLGLSISKSLIDMHGGTLTAASAGKDQGATFTVEMPTVSEPSLTQPPPPVRKAKHRSLRLLLVEDNVDTLRVMARLLKSFGHKVKTAASIHDALDVAQEPFDLVISDIGLPDGTGWDLMRTLHEHQPVRGIALSGFASDEDAQKSKVAGFTAHLAKPIDPDELESAIQQAVAPAQ
ncbi:MAG TPA: PAS domain S-box protein [Tepidisphaeraceae bacterium]|nr:PAS domain S-box protein [Tepidisphaeraceae bacterium]